MIRGIIESSWQRGSRRVQSEGDKALVTYLLDQLSGIGANESHVSSGIIEVSSQHLPRCRRPMVLGSRGVDNTRETIERDYSLFVLQQTKPIERKRTHGTNLRRW